MIGSPPRPGTKVNNVATIRTPLARAQTHQWCKLPRQRRNGRIGLASSGIGPVGMQEIVLQITEDERA